MKYAVSISISLIFPGEPNLIIHQSLPSVLFLLLSHPSIHLPWSSYLSSINTGSLSLSILETSPKKSSEKAMILVPNFGDARFTSFKIFSFITNSLK